METLSYLVLALLGGLILNVMPCVLPVLTLKAFKVFDKGKHSGREQRIHGLAYTFGTASFFLLLGGIVVGLKLFLGIQIGWGMQFRYPAFIAGLTTVIFVFSLNALGLFEITMSDTGDERSGAFGEVANGWFAAVMATPCSAPFLSGAAAFALGSKASWWQTLLIFTMIGIGLALPYLLLTFIPALSSKLPRPGAWMETFKHLMGFSLLGTAIWLFGSLQKQISAESANWFLFFLLVIAMGLWAIQRFAGLDSSSLRKWMIRGFALASVVAAGFFMLNFERSNNVAMAMAKDAPVVKDGHINWVPFDSKRLKEELTRNRPIFVDFTADWCASCKTNERVFLETNTVRNGLTKTLILPMKADMTNENAELDAWLAKLGRSGIPAYVIFYPDGSHDLMPITITAEMVAEHLKKASNRYPPHKYLPMKTAANAVPMENSKAALNPLSEKRTQLLVN
jgi:thiol:disulfide interchange protein